MYVVCVTSWVKPEHADDFMAACLDNARETRKESGNLRFDVLRCIEPENQFFLYEVYLEEKDFHRHHETPHYDRWRQTVEPWMEKPREGVKYNSLFPGDEKDLW